MKKIKIPKKYKKIKDKDERLKKILELSDYLYEEHFNENTASADLGDIIELMCLVADQLKELNEK